MKKMIFSALLFIATFSAAHSQNHVVTVEDSAAFTVDRYLRLLNINGLPKDSLLVAETTVTIDSRHDTVVIKRWYAQPLMFRVEVWHQGNLETGLVSNGRDRFKRYSTRYKDWQSIGIEDFNKQLSGYDLRGPLYDWRVKGVKLTWMGHTTLKEQALEVVKVECPDMFDRYYMFDPGSGLLTLIIEMDEPAELRASHARSHIEWKAIHEYLPLGFSLLPSLESFSRNGELTVLSSAMHFEPLDDTLFNHN